MKQMTEEAKEAKRQYYRAYRAKNPEKVKEANRRYWEKLAADSVISRVVNSLTDWVVKDDKAGA